MDPSLPPHVQEAVARQTGAKILPMVPIAQNGEPTEQAVPMEAKVLRIPNFKPRKDNASTRGVRQGKMTRSPEVVRDRARVRFDRCLDDAYAIAKGTPVEVIMYDASNQPRAMLQSPSVTERLKAMELLAKHGAMQQFTKARVERPLEALAQLLGVPLELVTALVDGTATHTIVDAMDDAG